MFIEKINKEVLLKPLQTVVGIVERKQPLPILSNVLIEKNATGIRFLATDLEIQISTEIKDAELAGSEESITVAAKKLQEILRVLPDNSKITLDIQDSRLLVKVLKSKFTLQTLPSQDFPKISEQLSNSTTIEIEQKLLKKLLGSVQYAMAQQDIRYYLNGVLLVIEGNLIKLIATDGHRLAYTSAKLNQEFTKREVILSRKTVSELFKLLSDNEEKITLELAEKQVKITFSDITLTTKVIDGKFPDYDRVIPSYTNHLNLDRQTILHALQRAAILSNEKFRGVRFVMTEKNMRIISSNTEQEEAQEDIENDYHGPALDIGFNVNYLLDGLSNANTQEITFSFGDSNSSILITVPGNEDFKYVVMPMRI
ncbi:MAG: DNA polymerase III subunit beta [Gallionellales bacterium 35-53-114]|jgi:DNA polymerase-3 subunit beta|nr:MAG: DNA polymerase III subunit beta [Gallionellales bacterium 35-53-114]OYZ63569.1 MAG: DNA polymerase III subunit beta [Gallionellales bacterium 24-53-125]OZB10821.1 MAG: DNA polymerase III subunit beta [Gallionellales bacterium 39-52-133]HQS59006.1 DNA polymerase III subunit beta [Gallionellaceae bacterium]HQS75609.1 DNA polymerase III subunit beta [Gallionellaceae bacterium]